MPTQNTSERFVTISMESIERHYGNAGHWFDRSTMRFFNCRLPQDAYANNTRELAYFVSSEQYDYKAPRLYTVRCYDFRTKDIRTVGEFQQYVCRSTAVRAAKALAAHQQNLP